MKIISILFSHVCSLSLLMLYAFLLAVATAVESYCNTATAQEWVYFNPYFIALQGVIALQLLVAVFHRSYWKRGRYGMMLTHLSIVLILIGALVTHLTGREGTMSLREGGRSSSMVLKGGDDRGTLVSLPFEVELKDFVLDRYPGSNSPSSYESHIVLHQAEGSQEHCIFMNNTLDVGAYRIFQLNYDKRDEKGSVLLINEDLFGRYITYTGYALLGLGLLLSLLAKHGRVRTILRELSRSTALILLGLSLMGQLKAQQEPPSPEHTPLAFAELHAVPDAQAAKFAALPMQHSNGRMAPVDTFASELLRKLSRSDTIGSLNANQFLLSLWLMPDVWVRIPLIEYKDVGIAEKYHLPPHRLALIDLIDESGAYQLQEEIAQIYAKDKSELSTYDKELMKLDERANIFNLVLNRQMVNLFPNELDANHKWYAAGDDLSAFEPEAQVFVSKILDWYLSETASAMRGEKSWEESQKVLNMMKTYQVSIAQEGLVDEKRLEAEVFYNNSHLFKYCRKLYLILGGLSLLLAFFSFTRQPVWMRCLRYLLVAGVGLSFLTQTAGMGLRWYISLRGPWSNSYETMVYVAWIVVLIGLVLLRRSDFVFSLATLFGGVILFVSGLSWLDPQISPLVPVLQSAWLLFHVAVIVASYGFFGIAFLLAFVNLLLICIKGHRELPLMEQRIKDQTLIQELLIWVGIALLAVGIFLGAIWANESWGRYWGWDPKETWALITLLCYVYVAHLRLVKIWDNPYTFNSSSLIAFISVLMTYFGVNYFLSGMHSYSSLNLNDSVVWLILGTVLALVLLVMIARLRYPNKK